MLETALKGLFDFQKFEQNKALQDVIDETMARQARKGIISLSDEMLSMAAGGVRSLADEKDRESEK